MARPAVEDELAIRELYARYSWALDTGDTDGYVNLFTEDAEATEETASGELEVRKGREEIRKVAPADQPLRNPHQPHEARIGGNDDTVIDHQQPFDRCIGETAHALCFRRRSPPVARQMLAELERRTGQSGLAEKASRTR